MAFRLNVFTIFLLVSIGYVLTSKNSDLVEHYQKNPFLLVNVNTSKDTSNSAEKQHENVSSNDNPGAYNNNPFLQDPVSQGNEHAVVVPLTDSRIDRNEGEERKDIRSTYTGEKTKSELVCEEYGKQVMGTTEVLLLVGGKSEVVKGTDEKCKNVNRLVVGGISAAPGEFPHMVALGAIDSKGKFRHSCGGTLIAPEWVLTAAHCTHGPERPQHVRIGFHNLKNQQGITTTINKIIRHPDYKPPAMYFDIALVKLNTVIRFNEQIKPACLYPQFDSVPTQAWVTGWGVTQFVGEEPSDELQKAQLDILNQIECAVRINQSIAVPYGITPSMICTGDPRGGWTKDTCQGDSGGPLQTIHPKNSCLFQVLGITSFGIGCALVDKPGVYTRVSHYLGWIEDIVWP